MQDDDFFDALRKILAGAVAVVLFWLGLTWVVQGNDFFLYKTFAPKAEAIRRETFEQSKAYNEGAAQELRRMQSEYLRAKPEQRDALASIVRHQFASFDETTLPEDLREFLRQVRSNQGGSR